MSQTDREIAEFGLAPSPPETLPDSAQEVYRLLALEGPLTHRELVSYTDIPARTIRYAIRRLKETELVGERVNLKDSRQRFFFVKREGSATTPATGPLL